MEFLKDKISDCEGEEEMVHILSNSPKPIVIDENPLELEICDNNTKKTRNKCGEIYTSDDEVFTFLCTFCSTLLEDIEKFVYHVSTQHINKSYTTDKTEDPLEPSDGPEDSWIKLEPNEEVELVNDSQISLAHSNEISDNEAPVAYYGEMADENNFNDLDTCVNVTTSNSNKQEDLVQDRTEYETKLNLDPPITKKKRIRKKNRVILLCDLCNKEFVSEKTFEVHRLFDHIPINPFVSLPNVESQNDVHTEDSDDEKIEKSAEVVQTFTQSVENDPFKCRYCDRKLGNRRVRYEHECTHTGEKPYSCEICGKSFRKNQTLNNHLRIHTDQRPHKCEFCDAAFNDRTNLIVHVRRHLGEKPFKCRFCDKTFVQSTGRTQHERIHTGEKPFQCIECGMCFQTSSKLGVHNRKHLGIRPYKCNDCDLSFFTKQELTKHTVKHTGERPFVCEVCNATFPRKKSLTSHTKTHSDITDYICKVCGKGFKVYQGLYSHMKSHGQKLNSSHK